MERSKLWKQVRDLEIEIEHQIIGIMLKISLSMVILNSRDRYEKL